MSHKTRDLVVKTGEYQDGSGAMKPKWLNVGSIIQRDDGGEFIIFDRHFNPAGLPNPENRSTIIISMFRKDEAGQGQAVASPTPKGGNFEDDIPF